MRWPRSFHQAPGGLRLSSRPGAHSTIPLAGPGRPLLTKPGTKPRFAAKPAIGRLGQLGKKRIINKPRGRQPAPQQPGTRRRLRRDFSRQRLDQGHRCSPSRPRYFATEAGGHGGGSTSHSMAFSLSASPSIALTAAHSSSWASTSVEPSKSAVNELISSGSSPRDPPPLVGAFAPRVSTRNRRKPCASSACPRQERSPRPRSRQTDRPLFSRRHRLRRAVPAQCSSYDRPTRSLLAADWTNRA